MTTRRLRATGRLLVVTAVVTASTVALAPPASPTVVGRTPDAWSSTVTLRTADGWYPAPIHAVLLPSGKVLLLGVARATDRSSGGDPEDPRGVRRVAFLLTPPAPGSPLPSQLQVDELREPIEIDTGQKDGWTINDDLFCMGQNLTAAGSVFTAGGTRSFWNGAGDVRAAGLDYSTLYDGTSWVRLPGSMAGTGPIGTPRRWYPTVTRLANGRMLVTGGFEVVLPNGVMNLSVSSYDPVAMTWSVVSPLGQTPVDIINSDYTHVFVLPTPADGHPVLMFGEPGVPVLMTPGSPATWELEPRPRPGSEAFQQQRQSNGGAWNADEAPDNGASSVMLPLRTTNGQWGYSNGSVLVAGGAAGTPFARAIDVYDPSAGAWHPSIDTGFGRHDGSTVLLPDGRVLIVGGTGPRASVQRSAYVDPAHGMAFSLGAADSGDVRGYHNVALLLPDGSVLVGGGRGGDTMTTYEKPNLRFYYPHYMFAARPLINAAPEHLSYDSPFFVDVKTKGTPAELVLLALGTMTHAFDSDQRSVQVSVTALSAIAGGRYRMSAIAPADARVAPPGYYMLFELDANRIPSVAKIVRVGP